MASSKVIAYLKEKVTATQSLNPALAEDWDAIESLYSRKLWHQLTLKLLSFVKNDTFATGTALVELYENLIKDLEDRINPVSLTTMLDAVIKCIPDTDAALALLDPIKEKIKNNDTAMISMSTIIASLHMKEKRLDEAKKILEDVSHQLDALPGVSPVHSDYYKASSLLCKVQGRHTDFYRESLRYLGTVDRSSLTEEDSVHRAYDMGLAALVGKGIYNIGELLRHGIMDSLRNTDKEWLVELLEIFNSGNVKKFKEMQQTWSSQSQDLGDNADALLEKVSLLSVMESVFQAQAKSRHIGFAELAAAADIPVDQIEKLVMKALALGLVKGSIDEIDQVATFTWVQPRVLTTEQLSGIHVRLGNWLKTVDEAVSLVESSAPELLAAH